MIVLMRDEYDDADDVRCYSTMMVCVDDVVDDRCHCMMMMMCVVDVCFVGG